MYDRPFLHRVWAGPAWLGLQYRTIQPGSAGPVFCPCLLAPSAILLHFHAFTEVQLRPFFSQSAATTQRYYWLKFSTDTDKICRAPLSSDEVRADVPAARQPGRVGERVDVWMSRLWDGTGGLIRDYDFVRDYDTSAPLPLLPLAHGAPSVTSDLATTAPRNYGNSSRLTKRQGIHFPSRNTAHIQPISPGARLDTQS